MIQVAIGHAGFQAEGSGTKWVRFFNPAANGFDCAIAPGMAPASQMGSFFQIAVSLFGRYRFCHDSGRNRARRISGRGQQKQNGFVFSILPRMASIV
jgi:hypothetical protein